MPGALSSLRILDFTTLYPGPLATVMLADLGADVLRVEAPDRPDLLRFMPPYDASGEGAVFRMINRNKRSIVLDLKAKGAADVVRRLVAHYEIVVEQFRPGVLERLGIGFETLRAVQPRLIWCSISSYGQTGPWRDRPGHDINFLALSGLAHHAGRADSGPVPSNALIGDVGGGTQGAVAGILAAVVHRQVSGEGQRVDVSMADGALWLNAMAAAGALAAGEDLERAAGPLNGGSAYDYYRCKDGGWLAVGAIEPKFWAAFCTAIDLPEAADVLMSDPDQGGPWKPRIADRIGQRSRAAWQAVFANVPCCVDAVLSTLEAVAHPQYAARGMVVDVPLPEGGSQRQIGNPVRLEACPAVYAAGSTAPGADTAAVLTAAGYSASEIEALRAGGTVG